MEDNIEEEMEVKIEIKVEPFTSHSNDFLEIFERRMESLKPMEKRSAKAFLDYDIPEAFLWSIKGESEEDANTRRKNNSKTIKSVRTKITRMNETAEVRKKRNYLRRLKISKESEESRNERLIKDRQRRLKYKAQVPEDIRNQRIERHRQRMIRARAQETEEARIQRIERDKQRKRRERAQESEETRNKRLEKCRLRRLKYKNQRIVRELQRSEKARASKSINQHFEEDRSEHHLPASAEETNEIPNQCHPICQIFLKEEGI
ncbi:uncharacterized protein [Lepeophtheirus salmonis]|uniref:uncharacterized protein n=1 Tax=Lepeophtheirus salmonis TaxID=72036 RepID=UPI001AE5D118|nr:apical junction molecule-like [Lepeophtheirus salmonis]XP_040571524.1 apical junction molecule-like [Lepeophtheirus salmonis]